MAGQMALSISNTLTDRGSDALNGDRIGASDLPRGQTSLPETDFGIPATDWLWKSARSQENHGVRIVEKDAATSGSDAGLYR